MSDSSEAVALRLLEILMQHEQIAAEFKEKPGSAARNWLLNSYGECLRSVIGGRDRVGRVRPRGRGEEGEGLGRLRRAAVEASSDED